MWRSRRGSWRWTVWLVPWLGGGTDIWHSQWVSTLCSWFTKTSFCHVQLRLFSRLCIHIFLVLQAAGRSRQVGGGSGAPPHLVSCTWSTSYRTHTPSCRLSQPSPALSSDAPNTASTVAQSELVTAALNLPARLVSPFRRRRVFHFSREKWWCHTVNLSGYLQECAYKPLDFVVK